eukprot:2330970-Rhodomonas_salina.1
MAGTEGDIARLKLQAAYVPVSKVTSTALKRWESEQHGLLLPATARAVAAGSRTQPSRGAAGATYRATRPLGSVRY